MFKVIITDDSPETEDTLHGSRSEDSLPSCCSAEMGARSLHSLEPDLSADEQEEKARLISQVLELQNTLDGSL